MLAQRLTDKVAIITGVASAIGAEHAILFALHGAKIIACDADESSVRDVVREIGEAGGTAKAQFVDPKNKSHWLQVVEAATQHFGKPTTLVNVTALDYGQDFDLIYNTTILGMNSVMPALAQTRNASIINVTPTYLCNADSNCVSPAIFSQRLSKLTRRYARQYGPLGVRVNTVCPGEITTNTMPRRHKGLPMQRYGFPEEVAYGSLFLCSDEASYITATELYINGGSHSSAFVPRSADSQFPVSAYH